MYQKILTTIAIWAIFLISTSAQGLPIGEANFSFTDPARANRVVDGKVYYPATLAGLNQPVAMGEFPIVVFGHGFVTAISEYQVWWEGLVPEGYIFILPTTEGGFGPSHADFGADISFLVDTYLAEGNNSSSIFFQHISGTSAVMGHSMGGGCSFLAAESNANVNAQVSLAAAETTPSAIAAAANITIPSLVIAGSKDCIAPPAAHQIPIYNALASSYKAYLEIIDGSHCQFGEASGFSNCVTGEAFSCPFTSYISKADQHTQMLSSTLPWLDYWLKADCNAWTTFHDYLTMSSNHTYMESGTAACCDAILIVDGTIDNGLYEAGMTILSDGLVPNGNDVVFHAGTSIELESGFEVELGASFIAEIEGCN